MWNRKHNRAIAACILASSPFVSTAISAEGLDGSGDIVCALTEVVGCTEDAGCIQGRGSSFGVPDFVVMDAKGKVMRGSDESGHEEVSPVKNIERSGDHLVLQGVESGRGWDMAINARTGTMSGAVVGDAVNILVFGACTAL